MHILFARVLFLVFNSTASWSWAINNERTNERSDENCLRVYFRQKNVSTTRSVEAEVEITLSVSECMNINHISCHHFRIDPESTVRSHKLCFLHPESLCWKRVCPRLIQTFWRATTTTTTPRFQFHFPCVHVHNVRMSSMWFISRLEIFFCRFCFVCSHFFPQFFIFGGIIVSSTKHHIHIRAVAQSACGCRFVCETW